MEPGFTLAVSDNLISVTFTSSFHRPLHYRYLVNAVLSLSESLFQSTTWALRVEWGEAFIQIPEEEKLCFEFMSEYEKRGLRYTNYITPAHPLVDWQVSRLQANNPDIEFLTSVAVEDGEKWLRSKGVDTRAHPRAFEQTWRKPTSTFMRLSNNVPVSEDGYFV